MKNYRRVNSRHRKGLLDLISHCQGVEKMAEIGCALGDSSVLWVENIPGVMIYLIDPWNSTNIKKPEFSDYGYDVCLSRISKLTKNYCVFRMLSSEAIKKFPDNFLNLVYIDGNHSYSYVKEDIFNWYKKIIPNEGFICGHDYCINSVKKAVDEFSLYMNNKKIFLFDDSSWLMEI